MKATVFGIDGSPAGEVQLPVQFGERFRPDLIKRAVLAEATWRLQPKGVYRWAGLQTSAEYVGERRRYHQMINIGRARLPKEKLPKGGLGRVRIVPHSVKGRRAHPPRTAKILREEINSKELTKAIRCAIAATGMKDVVAKRGHAIKAVKGIPLIVDDSIQSAKKSKEVLAILEKLGCTADLSRALKRKARTGTGGRRRGGVRVPKSALIVVAADGGIGKAARSIPGVDVAMVDRLTAEALAPGAVAGRLTVWSRSAISKLGELYVVK